MIKIALVDDEKIFREKIRNKVENMHFEEIQVDCFSSADEFIEYNKIYDILLLDIEMPGTSGIELANQISDEKTLIIYITNYSSHMENAFGINVFKFITKDKWEDKIEKIIEEAITYVKNHEDVQFKTDVGLHVMKQKDIIYFTYYRKNIYLYTKSREYVIKSTSLEQMMTMITSSSFIQVNRDSVVNKNYIKAMKGLNLELKYSDTVLEVSRRRKVEVLEAFMEQVEKL